MKISILAGVAVATISVASVAISSAFAADMPRKAPVYKSPSAIIASSWTGFYVGVNAGVAGSQSNAEEHFIPAINPPPSGDINGTGWAGGAQAGYNFQIVPQWVLGVEGDIGYLGNNHSYTAWNDNVVLGVKTGGYGTIRGRFGYSTGPSLIYATGGGAFAHVRNSASHPGFGFSSSKTQSGWAAGGGIETMIASRWSARAEYLYMDFGDMAVPYFATTAPTVTNRFHTFRFGLNYLFNPSSAAPTGMSAMPEGASWLSRDHNWTGFYAGLNAGIGVANVRAKTPTLNPGSQPGEILGLGDAGFTGGFQAGYNWQVSPAWVVGVEGDIGYLGLSRTLRAWGNSYGSGVETDGYGTIRGRLAYSTGPALFYVTGGAAFVQVENLQGIFTPPGAPNRTFLANSVSTTASGWTVGGGAETMLTDRWSAKLEYLFIDVGSQTVTALVDPIFVTLTSRIDNRFQVVKFGLNYKFGAPGQTVFR